VIAVLGLIANAVLLVVRTRVREIAVLQALGYPDPAVVWLVLLEGMLLGFVGGIVGVGSAIGLLAAGRYSFGNEGQVLAVDPNPAVLGVGLAMAVALGAAAALYPAWSAIRRPTVEALRT
jgi:putative ABC transport system permease protein